MLQIAEGYTVDLPPDVHETLNERTDPTWPTHWFVPNLTGSGPFRDVYSVMNNWGANHGAFSYGHIGADLITLASMLRMPVFMHNVKDADVYRPPTPERAQRMVFALESMAHLKATRHENVNPLDRRRYDAVASQVIPTLADSLRVYKQAWQDLVDAYERSPNERSD